MLLVFSNTLKVFVWEKGNQFSLMAAGGRGSPVGVQQHVPGLEKNPAWTDECALGLSWCCLPAQGCFSVSLPVPQRSHLSLAPVHDAFWHGILHFLVFNFAHFCVWILAAFGWQMSCMILEYLCGSGEGQRWCFNADRSHQHRFKPCCLLSGLKRGLGIWQGARLCVAFVPLKTQICPARSRGGL